MASRKTLNTQNLVALGAERLAGLLIEISAGDAAARRRLRLELASAEGPAEAAREIRKRLTTIGRSRAFVDWDKVKALSRDLDDQRRAIVDQVAPSDPVEALDLMWRFLGLAASVFERCDDSHGSIGRVFGKAMDDLVDVAATAQPSPGDLAERAFAALCDNDYGQYDGLVGALAPVLGGEGLIHLKQRVADMSDAPPPPPTRGERLVVGWGESGPFHADQLITSVRVHTVRRALADIADALGDADAYIAQYDENARASPAIAARIAERLLGAGRAREALEAVQRADVGREGRRLARIGEGGRLDDDLEAVRIAALDALGRADEAQAARWRWFERSLLARALRDHLKRLPDFDDVEVEERALDVASAHADVHAALSFLIGWPALAQAAAMTLRRTAEIDGDRYEILTPAAEALMGKHPLAATLLLREMIDFTLEQARASRYRHAARHLQECASLAASIADFEGVETHDAYVTRLRIAHGRKAGFWSLLD